jgi:eukaryotic-like serine/threonine-protein kinase
MGACHVSLQPGTKLGPYEIQTPVGRGGMGEVFRATDTRLGRAVAIKICQAGFDTRFEREARSIAALNHPNICTLYDVGPNFLVMELVEGETLADVLRKGPCPVERVLVLATEIAGALAAAHARGIVHRDLKPGNVMITPSGVKVLDFGLAKLTATVDSETVVPAGTDSRTVAGQVLGTVPYMSPEQLAGKAVDERTDVFAFGVMCYEMLCGRRPFGGDTHLAALASILQTAPEAPSHCRPEIPKGVERVVMRCLERNPDARYGSAAELHRDLVSLRPAPVRRSVVLRAALIGVAVTLLLGASILAVQSYLRASRVQWVTQEAIPEITNLINANRLLAALELFQQAESYAPASAALAVLGESLVRTERISFETTPPGARIYISDYIADAGDDLTQWTFLGVTPLESSEIPRWGYYRMRAVKEGYATVDHTYFPQTNVRLTLHATEETPSGMTWVPAGAVTMPTPLRARTATALNLPGFWMDRYEVTNRQFKAFVDAGAYRDKKYWAESFIESGREMSWDTAMERFRDLTGRPGPAGWQLGTFSEGAAEMPVAGVSWYEAAAYANFVSKSLPTVHEWFAAAGAGGPNSEILTLSNFGTRGPAPVGSHRGMSPFGSYDMAGNVKEWVLNSLADRRYVLGAAWDEGQYTFNRFEAKSPLSREPTIGFRLVRRVSAEPPDTADPVLLDPAAFHRGQPVDDRTFEIFKRLHAYDKTELESAIDRTTELSFGRRETVSFRAAYGSERMKAHLFLPNNSRPPYQIVAFFGHASILRFTRIEALEVPYEFIVRSGRALVIPVFSGSLERGPSDLILPPSQQRERSLRWSMDLGRSLDYLTTRSDIDMSKLGFYGVSLGAGVGPRLIAVDPRFKTAVLLSGGMYDHELPEVNVWNFLPRVRIPVLMLNGRDDFIFPVETHQKPLFDALGTKEPDKVFRQYDGGHANLLTRPDLIRDILDWLDKHLGPVDHQP